MKGMFEYYEDDDVKKKKKKKHHKKHKKNIDAKELVSGIKVAKSSSKPKDSKITINLIPTINYSIFAEAKAIVDAVEEFVESLFSDGE